MAHTEPRRSVLLLVLLATVAVAATYGQATAPPPSSPGESQRIGKLLSVRKVLENRYFVSRYPQIHYYMLYFAIRVSDRTYCGEYETPVIDEIDDLFSAKDKEVELIFQGKSLTLRMPRGRKIKAHLVNEKQC